MNTIAAISTPIGTGGIGVIRVSGTDAFSISDSVFISLSGKRLFDRPGYTALYGHIIEKDGSHIDEAIATCFRAPLSYTGENVVEFSCHSGIYLLRKVLSRIYEAGAVQAKPGEFTERAFLNGKIDLTEAEAVMDIISAAGETSSRAAIAGKEGILSRKISSIKDMTVSLLSHLSAWADFPDEDVPELDRATLLSSVISIKDELRKLLATFDSGKIIREGVDTVIAGSPNAGKSTLMNFLSGCEKSIVTPVAGTTRDIVEERIMLGDTPLILADTAGIRSTDDPVESIGVKKAIDRVRQAGLILAVFDSSRSLSDDDMELIDNIGDIPSVAVINKSDLPLMLDTKKIEHFFAHTVFISAKNGNGIDNLKTAVAEVLGTDKVDPSSAMLFSDRQRESVRKALDYIVEAENASTNGVTFDAITVLIESATECLMELSGEKVSDKVIDEVFSKFCVGK
jgi:tRNA modification GTPase